MKDTKEIIKSYLGNKFLIRTVTATPTGIRIKGFLYDYGFEADISDAACSEGIDAGRVMNLLFIDPEENALRADSEIARYDGKWRSKPSEKGEQAIVDYVVGCFEKLPTHEALESEQKQTA